MQAFGIAALVFAIAALFMPIIGTFIAGLSGFLAIFSAGKGTTYGLSSVIINIVNIMFLSPSLIISASSKHPISSSHQAQAQMIFSVLLLIQITAIFVFIVVKLLSKKKVV